MAHKDFEVEECIIIDSEIPGRVRVINWKDGTSRRVLAMPESMWYDYFNKRVGSKWPIDDAYTEIE